MRGLRESNDRLWKQGANRHWLLVALTSGRFRPLALLALLIWMGVILFLSSRSYLPTDSPVVGWLGQYQDEVGHLVEYGVLGMLAYLVLRLWLNRRRAFFLGLAFCVAFAIGDETFQSLVPNRTPEVKDLFLDTLAAAGALMVALLVEPGVKRYRQRREP